MTIILFIVLLALLILVHEVGHFVSARRSGVKVEEFGFGFPPRILGVKKGETIWSLNWLPFGGFVKIFGEEGEHKEDPASFAAKPPGKRAVIVAAGVFMNFVLAALLLSLLNGIGIPTLIGDAIPQGARDIAIRILEVRPDSPASSAGLQLGDQILSVSAEGLPVQSGETYAIAEISTFQELMRRFGGTEIIVSVRRGKETLDLALTPRQSPPEGEGPIGVALGKTAVVSYPWYEALWRGPRDAALLTWQTLAQFGVILKTLVTEGRVVGELAGPVGIIVIGGAFAGLGASYLLQFAALLSINLAIINLLPIPALDGGRLLFLAIEKVRGIPVKRETEAIIHRIGFAFLLALIVLVTFRDISRFF